MTDNETLNEMRDRWQHLWRIWRSTDYNGGLGEWCATRLDPAAGPDATVMCSSPGELEAELLRQGALAAEGAQAPTISAAFRD